VAYSLDTGLCNAVGFRFSENIGKLAENIVFLELHRRQIQQSDTELYYWKDVYRHEVDFVVKKGQKVDQLIQVCWNVSDPKTKDREIRSLMKAMDELEKTEATIITEEYDTVEELKNGSFLESVGKKQALLTSLLE
jgi:predicted AAA+ superfamily ATPase